MKRAIRAANGRGYAMVVFIAGSMLAAATAVADPPLPPGTAGLLVAHYGMHPVPQEGAWFSLTYSSEDQIDGAALPPRYAGRVHAAGNAIVAVVTPRDFSAMHRLQSDEVWHFYGGSPLDMLLLYPDGRGRRITLGSNVLAGEWVQFTVPHGVWQGSAPRGASAGTYSFVGTQLSPAFDPADFEMGYRDELQRQYPEFSKDILGLTRREFASRPADRPAKAEGSANAGGSAKTQPALPATVFSARDVPVATVSPGVSLQELVGRVAPNAKTPAVSVAQFTLAPGHASGVSWNHRSQEVFLVTGGTGRVRLADKVIPVGRDSIVFIPAEEVHSIEADTANTLSFYAISAPAFAPEDYVLVKP
jgi:predicted cupin superfamily sugar epimerase/mannose-6-phosphate isomerase-like protein (cupin superfamily)